MIHIKSSLVLGILNIPDEDISESQNYQEIIELREDINIAIKKLKLTQPLNSKEIELIAKYLTVNYNMR